MGEITMVMKLIDLGDIIEAKQADANDRAEKAVKIEADDWLSAIIDKVNSICAKGYRFNGFMYSNRLDYEGVLIFEPSKKSFEYTIGYGSTFNNAVSGEAEKLTRYGAEEIEEQKSQDGVLPAMMAAGNVHAVVYMFNITTAPFYFIAEEVGAKKEEVEEVETKPTGKAAPKKVGRPKGSPKK